MEPIHEEFGRRYLKFRKEPSYFPVYILRTLEDGSVKCLLPIVCLLEGDQLVTYYEVTGHESLASQLAVWAQEGTIRSFEACRILTQTLQCIIEAEEFLIPIESLCLRTEFMFINSETMALRLILTPQKEKQVGIAEQLMRLLDEMELALEQEQWTYYSSLIRKTIETGNPGTTELLRYTTELGQRLYRMQWPIRTFSSMQLAE